MIEFIKDVLQIEVFLFFMVKKMLGIWWYNNSIIKRNQLFVVGRKECLSWFYATMMMVRVCGFIDVWV